jgi:hypothetical protein
MTTRDDLQEMRGLIESTIRTKLGERFPDLRTYMIEEAAVEIVAKGHVKTIPEFRIIFNKFMETIQINFGLSELQRLTRMCGVETGQHAKFPVYCQSYPKPTGVTDEQAGHRARQNFEAWHEKYEEIRRLIMTFGSPEMCKAFDEKERTPWLPVDVLDPVPENAQRFFYTPAEFVAEFTTRKWESLLSGSDVRIVLSPDYQVVVDVMPKEQING